MKFLAALVPFAIVSQFSFAGDYLTVFERRVPWTGLKRDYLQQNFFKELRVIRRGMREAFDRVSLPECPTLRLQTQPQLLNEDFSDEHRFTADVRCNLLVLSENALTVKSSVKITEAALIIRLKDGRGHFVRIPAEFSLTQSIARVTENGARVTRFAPKLRAALSARLRQGVPNQDLQGPVRLELQISTAADDFTSELGSWTGPGFRKLFYLDRWRLNPLYWLNLCRAALTLVTTPSK